jgi:hypothetical protein
LSSLNYTKKTNLDKKTYFQSQTDQYNKIQNFQSSFSSLSLSSPPSLQFQRNKKLEIRKDSVEQKTENKRSLDNTKENLGKHIDNATIIQYPLLNTDNLNDYYRQTIRSIKEISLDYLKLQKDSINAFQPPWVQHIENSVDNYLDFQNKMIMLYNQICIGYYKTIYDIKKNKGKEKEGSRI